MTAKQLNACWWAYLAILVYRLGGVAGAVRRIVLTWQGEFSCQQIEDSLRQLYPGLRPGVHQVADLIDRMRRQQIIERYTDERGVKMYRRCERRQAVPAEFNPQLTFSL